jgi:tetratricopeptide (TPR) repeat protein
VPHGDAAARPDRGEDPRDGDTNLERESAYELFRRGTELLDARHPGAAAVILERAARLEPGKASILEALGRAYYAQGQHALAAARFEEIVGANPLADYAHFGLGLSRERLGDARAARAHLRMAVILRPESEDYRRALARVDST